MTRKRQSGILFLVVAGLVLLIGAALAAKLSGIPVLQNVYDLIRDTSLLIATVVAAYLAVIYQQRAQFIQSLREQWREIVQAKSAMIYYAHLEAPKLEDYLRTAQQLSETIDNMRIVYANVGETEECIGFYPYAPLHHMRIIMETLDPRKGTPTPDQRFKARGEIWDAFNAIREHFLDEFDINEPSRPILAFKMKRKKKTGAADYAMGMHKQQMAEIETIKAAAKDIEYTSEFTGRQL
ncbi:MAG: hypothetical protein SGJ17_05525 [Hyphomicrobiales bacterium]|nr:hypothetical protein [Hyphomicrobiales bacterium]